MTSREVNTKIARRKERLKNLFERDYPSNSNLEFRHEAIQATAREYYAEMADLTFESEYEIFIVSEKTFVSKMSSADFFEIEDEGKYFRLALVGSFPSKPYYLLTLMPLSEI